MLAGIASLWHQDEWQALLAGLAYVVLYALLSQAEWQARLREMRYLRRHLRLADGVRQAGGPLLRDLAGVAAAVGYPFVMVILGVYSPADVGLGTPRWGEVLGPLLAGTALTVAWLAFLWGERRGEHAPQPLPPGSQQSPAVPAAVVGAVRAEGQLAICRAALMPLLGSYWGMWLGVVMRMLAAHTSPRTQWRLQTSTERRRVYLDWALDWVSTAILALTNTLWAGLLVRILCLAALQLALPRSATSLGTPLAGDPEQPEPGNAPEAASSR